MEPVIELVAFSLGAADDLHQEVNVIANKGVVPPTCLLETIHRLDETLESLILLRLRRICLAVAVTQFLLLMLLFLLSLLLDQ